jgi:hypothetical protein
MARRVGDAQDDATCRAPSVGGALCAAIEELKETFLRWIESEKLPRGRGVSADELPEAAPVVPPEKTLKEPSKRYPRPMEAARKLQRQTVVLPPKKSPIPDSTEALEAGRHRGAIRAVSAYAEVAAQSLARSTATRTFFTLRLGTGSRTCRASDDTLRRCRDLA